MKIEGYQKWKVQWLDLWGSFCEQKCNDNSRLRRAWIKSFKLKISNNRLKTKYHSTCPILRLSEPRLMLWHALKCPPNLAESRLQISCQHMQFGQSTCTFRISQGFPWCQDGRYIADSVTSSLKTGKDDILPRFCTTQQIIIEKPSGAPVTIGFRSNQTPKQEVPRW